MFSNTEIQGSTIFDMQTPPSSYGRQALKQCLERGGVPHLEQCGRLTDYLGRSYT